jgi:hypothetical protein
MADVTFSLSYGQLSLFLAGSGVVLGSVAKWFADRLAHGSDALIKKRAEHLASHQDIKMLVEDIRATEAAKQEVSDRIWDRQARWTEKKRRYVAAIRRVVALEKNVQFLLDFEYQNPAFVKANGQALVNTTVLINKRSEALRSNSLIWVLFFKDTSMTAIKAFLQSCDAIASICAAHMTALHNNQPSTLNVHALYDELTDRKLGIVVAAKLDLGYE